MRLAGASVVIAIAGLSSFQARAFDQCDGLLAAPGELRAFVVENGVRNAPMRYVDQARSIGIETEAPDRLIPVARLDAQGNPVIVYPSAFPSVLCRMALATFLEVEGEWRPFAVAARDAAICASRRPRDTCLVEYAKDLERSYRASFQALSAPAQKLAYELALDSLGQIAKHEYAHHLLRHAERIQSGGLARIDAEFEADFYALENAAQSGQAPSAMFYLFKPLADMESYVEAPPSPDYESGSCRAANVDDITGLFGTAPIVLLDAVYGGGQLREETADLPALAAELARQAPPVPDAASCGRLAPLVLREAHAELVRLIALVAEYADLLPATWTETEAAGGLGLSTEEIVLLVGRLEAALQGFVHLKGLTARALSILILRLEYGGTSSAVSQQLDGIIDSAAEDILASDYGRLLQVKGLRVFYDASGRPLGPRADEAQALFEAAVTLLPGASESWMNLAYIALIEGDCDHAAELADKSAGAAGNEKVRGMAEAFRDDMRATSAAGRCAEASERFAAGFAR